MIAALAGGVGAAKFLAGLVRSEPPREITAIVNVADDQEFHGLYVCPDIDSVTYTLGGVNNTKLGWGRESETFRTIDELGRFGVANWFRLGDLDLATHIFRTDQLRKGRTLAEVTNHITRSFEIEATLIPATNDRITTVITAAAANGEPHDLAMQEWFVRDRCEPIVRAVHFEGADGASPAPGVLAALADAEIIVICPSNPVISIGPLLAIPGIKDLLADRRDRVVAISPIVAGAPVKGPADLLMRPLGIEVSCFGVAEQYREFCSTVVFDIVDQDQAERIEAVGVRCVSADTMMTSPDVAAKLAGIVVGAMR